MGYRRYGRRYNRKPRKPSMTIERERGETYNRKAWAVYSHGVYPSGSVLAGQPMRRFVAGGFETPDAAKMMYPDAHIIDGTTHIPVRALTRHLPDDDDILGGEPAFD